VNPLSSYQYQDIGVNVDMTPTVTLDGDIRLDLTLDNSQLGPDTNVGGVTVPSFVQRKVSTRLRLRDGESNLLAGLLQTTDQKGVSGFPGLIHVPFLSDLFASNTVVTNQTEIVMLLTPHIVRAHEITETDLRPIFIGSQQNLGIGGPQPLIAPQQPDAAPPPGPAPVPGAPPAGVPGTPAPVRGPGGTTVVAPPGSSPVPGTVLLPPATPPVQQPPAQPPAAVDTQPQPPSPPVPPAPTPAPTPPPAGPPDAAAVPTTSAGIGSAQVLISPPGPTFRVGGGPYTVPLLINDATRISTVTLTLIFDPTKLRVNRVQEGSFLRSGGVPVVFTQSANGNRIDISLSRGADATGASGTGVLAAILFDAIGPGPVTLTLSGSATGPGGAAMGLRFTPVTVTVQ
jgi:general secretion pathway protein D